MHAVVSTDTLVVLLYEARHALPQLYVADLARPTWTALLPSTLSCEIQQLGGHLRMQPELASERVDACARRTLRHPIACACVCVCCCCHPMQACDRILLITEPLTNNGPASFLAAGMGGLDTSDTAVGSNTDLHVHHVLLPAMYLAANWPLRHVAVSPCGNDIAAAGNRGLAIYNRKQERWRLFGEVTQVRHVDRVGMWRHVTRVGV